MRHERIRRIARLTVVVALAACGSDSPTEPADVLNGAWLWVESTGGILSQTRTPGTEGYDVRLQYDGHGRVHAFRGSMSAGTSNYTLTELPTSGPLPVYEVTYDPPLQAFLFDALDTHAFRFVANGEAILVDPCCDRWAHTFVSMSTIRFTGGGR